MCKDIHGKEIKVGDRVKRVTFTGWSGEGAIIESCPGNIVKVEMIFADVREIAFSVNGSLWTASARKFEIVNQKKAVL